MAKKTFATDTNIQTISLAEAKAGDAVFCHSTNIFGKAIRYGQKLHGFAPEFRVWNHIAWLDEPILDASGKLVDWQVGQAIAHGVDDSHRLSTIAPGGKYEIVSMDSFPTITGKPIDRESALATLRSQVGKRYGYATIAAEVFDILTPHFLNIEFRQDDTWICSALYLWGLHSGGADIGDVDVYHGMPAAVALLSSGVRMEFEHEG